jgi:phosphate transport system substrate-binding protein
MRTLTPLLWVWVVACAPPLPPPTLVGQLRLEGSTTVAPIITALLADVAAQHPQLMVQVLANGSGNGISAAGTGRADLGMSSRALKQADLDQWPDLQTHAIARDGLAAITQADNPVRSLTLAQLHAVFTGEVRNWSSLGGPDLAIEVVARTPESGTGTFFQDQVMAGQPYATGHLEFAQSTDLEQYVGTHPGAVGYAGLAFVDERVHALALDAFGIVTSPDERTVRSGQYPLSRDLLILTNGEPTGLARTFLELLISQQGQQAVLANHYVPVR